jgi:Lon protease-like protein
MPVSRETLTLPLFPVQGVLFPGTRLSFKMEETRYRRVIQECTEHDTPMAVVWGRPGPTGALEPASVATVARILESQAGPDGPVALTVVGVSRLSLVSYRQGSRVLVGQGRFLPDLAEETPPPLVDEAYALASEYVGQTAWFNVHDVPTDPEALSYWVAQMLPWELPARQEILEERRLAQRLATEVGRLRQLLDEARTARPR